MDDNTIAESSSSATINAPVEDIGEPDHLKLVSTSDLFTPTGRTTVGVTWDLSVKKIDDHTCEFTNVVHTSFTPELTAVLAKQGIPMELFRNGQQSS